MLNTCQDKIDFLLNNNGSFFNSLSQNQFHAYTFLAATFNRVSFVLLYSKLVRYFYVKTRHWIKDKKGA